jgi:RNA polymerase sigma-70 factor (ECF subfamily)
VAPSDPIVPPPSRAPAPSLSRGDPPDSDPERPALEALARGDRKLAIALLAGLYEDVVHACCHRMLRDPLRAEDVLQQVFLQAHRDLGDFAGRGSLRGWLLGITNNRCLDAIKASKRLARRMEDDVSAVENAVDESPDPLERVDQGRRVRALEGCLDELSPEVRMTVLLRFQLGLSYAEIGAILDARAGTLQQRVARALPALKACLERKGVAL